MKAVKFGEATIKLEGVPLPKGGRQQAIRIKKNGKIDQWYFITGTDADIFPLKMGTGSYTIQLYEQRVAGVNMFRHVTETYFNFKSNNPNAWKLEPNNYVYWSEESPCIARAARLVEGLETIPEKYEAIKKWNIRCIMYDYIKARKMARAKNQLPDIEHCFQFKKGVCYDKAALAVAMLRSQGVPSEMVIGGKNGGLHAWVETTIDGKKELWDPTKAATEKDVYKETTRY